MRALQVANLALLILFPISWTAPLMRAGVLPLFGLEEISVLSGIAALWEDEKLLAVLVTIFALIAPMAKTIAIGLIHLGRLPGRALRVTTTLGKLAMADIFLIALYIVLARGVSVGRIETAWGLWLFTACVLTSLAISVVSDKRLASARVT